MTTAHDLSHLEAFARERIAALRHRCHHHTLEPVRCSTCGVVPLGLTIEQHNGSIKGQPGGLTQARCSECGKVERYFAFRPEVIPRESLVCQCGNATFLVAEYVGVIIEPSGRYGFIGGGVVVAKCADCGRNRVLHAYGK